jgi:phage gpG-like protein
MFYFEARGIDPTEFAHNLLPRLQHAKAEMVGEVARNAERYAKANARRGRPGLNCRSGKLEGAIFSRFEVRNQFEDGFEIGVGVDLDIAPYGRIHEFGGAIRARRPGGWLQFRSASGNWVKVRSVVIPKREYLKPAFETAITDIASTFAAEVFKEGL